MESSSICRCCLAEGKHKDMHTPYVIQDKKEIYSDILQQCFNIVLSLQEGTKSICNKCIDQLKNAHDFKKQVLYSEEMITKMLHNKKKNELELLDSSEAQQTDNGLLKGVHNNTYNKINQADIQVTVKYEPKSEDDNSNDSDNCFLSRIVKEESPKKKTEDESKVKIKKTRSRRNLVVVKREKKIRLKEMKDKTKLANLVNVDIKYNTKAGAEKKKHKDNLITVLKYSNVLPFKDKSLVGFICGYCDKTYQDPIDLRTHTESDHKNQRLELLSPSDLNEYQVKLEVTDLKCTICDQNVDNLRLLKEHLAKSHNKTIHSDIKDHLMPFKLTKGDIFNCSMCSAKYETFKMLKQHMNMHYTNYICQKCSSSFITKRSLNAHKATHIEGSFKCDLCEKIFSNRAKKLYHERTSHMGFRNISNCPFCDESFRSYYQRNQHLVKVHNSEAQYKCNICSKSYILKSLLMSHIKKNHMMERNYQCTECGYKFFNRKTLKAHMIKHTGERKYACEVCHKSYARKYTLREHMRIHNNDRRFKCELCGNAFVQKCSLKSHLLSNHGISMAASDITVS